jgi:hypothetical protein
MYVKFASPFVVQRSRLEPAIKNARRYSTGQALTVNRRLSAFGDKEPNCLPLS